MPHDSGRAKCRVYTGVAGWSYPDWRGIVYSTKPGGDTHPLRLISSLFDVVEIDTSFYRIPAPVLCRKWVSLVEDRKDFRFTVKLFRGFTHEPGSRGH